MNEWESKFTEETLDRGRALYFNNKVVDLKKTAKGYAAAVLMRQRFEVSMMEVASGAVHMNCKCPAARGGRNCEHMAALMYAVQAAETAEKSKADEAELLEKWRMLDKKLERKKVRAAQEEKQKKEKQIQKQMVRREASMSEEEKNRKAQMKAEKAREEQRRREEEKAEEEKRLRAEQKAIEEQKRLEEEREQKRLAREKRKAERERQKEEQKRLAQEAAQAEYEKRKAEEERREKIRRQKAEEAKMRAEKKRRQKEEAERLKEKKRLEEEKRAKEEAAFHAAEEKRRQEEERRQREIMKKIEEEKIRKERERQKREEEYTTLGGQWEEETSMESPNYGNEMESLEKYRYYDAALIRNSVTVSQKTILEGKRLLEQGKIGQAEIMSGFSYGYSDRAGQLDTKGKEGNWEFPIRIQFSRDKVSFFECGCKRCYNDYYSRYHVEKITCPYKAGALLMLEQFLERNNIGDSTDYAGEYLLSAYERKRVNFALTDTESGKESLRLIPRLVRKDGKLSLSFKVGENKLFVIKKLDVFCNNVKNSATDIYGTNTELNHAITNFTEEGKDWIRLINSIVTEEKEFQQRLQESSRYYGTVKDSIGGNLNLFGWRLDELYKMLDKKEIDFEDRDSNSKKKVVLTCAERDPKINMTITEDEIAKNEFHGIVVKGNLPAFYHGTDTAYFIDDKHLNRVSEDFALKTEPLEKLVSSGGNFLFHVGRNRMSEFYSKLLPKFEEIADITETDPGKFRSYLLPEPRFTFYLDAEEGDASCRIYVNYGDREFSVVELEEKANKESLELFRDYGREREVLYHAMQWLPEVDLSKGELRCYKDEQTIYRLMKSGTEKLMELGEVRCTKRFLGKREVRKVKVSVGVSVSSNLLELDVTTEDVSAAELLDILKSYRKKQSYFRLKNGAFVDLEEPSLEMLSELTEAMNLKDKELLKGKLKVPMFRTLYLDKLLEESEGVYSTRDSHFREVVKGFKTVKDADYEEPETLSKIMRKYQKDGYKWLRTLETWKFGGILADDMGLGKTLQVIAVLLAAKKEGKKGTSLVVSPASLVYNWGAEFEKFAPELKVSLITGNQEERQNKLDALQEADVIVTSYDLLKRDIASYEDKEFLYEIIDEAQYIKNHTTATAKAVKVIHSAFRYALTGTPIENRLSELWSIFDYLMPGFLYSYEVFKREIETPIVKNNDEKAMKRLQKMVGPFILRRLKENVLKDLPDKLEEYRYVRLGEKQQQIYDGQVLHMKEQLARQDKDDFNKNKLQILAELTRLRQICCDPSLCLENYKGETAKLEACLELIQSAIDGGHRILVFSQFTSMLEILQSKLDEQKIGYYVITGSTTKEKRMNLVKCFNEGETPVFLISLKAGGVGLNLTGADVVIHYDPWWNLAAQNQATDRAHRIGQKKKVTVYKLIARHTIEEKIQKLQETKKDLADQVMGGESAAGLGSMSREELMELLEI